MSIKVVEVTEEQFEAYVSVQLSGVTNMWAVDTVISLSRGLLSEDDCLYIMRNYVELRDHFKPYLK